MRTTRCSGSLSRRDRVGVFCDAVRLAVWKPVQRRPLSDLFGGYFISRVVHFTPCSGSSFHRGARVAGRPGAARTAADIVGGRAASDQESLPMKKFTIPVARLLEAVPGLRRAWPILPGCNYDDPQHPDVAGCVSAHDVRLEQRSAGSAVQPTHAGADLQGMADYPAAAIQRISTISAWRHRSTSNWRLGLTGRSATSSPGGSINCARSRRKVRSRGSSASRDGGVHRPMERRAAASFSARGERGHEGTLCLVPMRRWVFYEHRHGSCVAPADDPGARFPRRAVDRAIRRTVAPAHSDETRFQEPKSVVAMGVTNRWTGGYWENQGYNWFSGS